MQWLKSELLWLNFTTANFLSLARVKLSNTAIHDETLIRERWSHSPPYKHSTICIKGFKMNKLHKRNRLTVVVMVVLLVFSAEGFANIGKGLGKGSKKGGMGKGCVVLCLRKNKPTKKP